MTDFNKEALAIWESLKPAVDKEIERKTAGTVQRRKVVVSTAPSSLTGLVGVQEPFGVEFFVPYRTEVAAATVGDPVWIEFAYGANNAVAIGMASLVDTGTQTFDDVTITGTLDITPRRCYAMLSSAGWYRVMQTNDVSGTIIDFRISRRYGANPAEAHKISFYIVGDGKSAFLDETSDTNTLCVDKIRVTYGGGFIYFDVHYNTSSANEVLVYFDVYGKGQANGTSIAMGLAPVADSPVGETVLTTYEFTANGIRTVTLTSAHSSVTINAQKAVRSGNVVSLWVDFTVSASISGYAFLIYAPTFATNTNALVYDINNTVQTNVRLYADAGNTGLRCYIAFPAGRYIAFVTYITTDV